MKTKEELNALKEEVETLNRKLRELTEDELKEVASGLEPREAEWHGSGYQIPWKEEIKEGHIFKPIGDTQQHGNDHYIFPKYHVEKHRETSF